MLAPNVISAADLFRPRTTIDSEGTVEGYASLFGEVEKLAGIQKELTQVKEAYDWSTQVEVQRLAALGY